MDRCIQRIHNVLYGRILELKTGEHIATVARNHDIASCFRYCAHQVLSYEWRDATFCVPLVVTLE